MTNLFDFLSEWHPSVKIYVESKDGKIYSGLISDIDEEKASRYWVIEGTVKLQDGISTAEQIFWCERWIRETKKKIHEYKAYIVIAENYKDIIDFVSNSPDFRTYQKMLEEKYDLDWDQAKLVKMVTINDLLSVDKY